MLPEAVAARLGSADRGTLYAVEQVGGSILLTAEKPADPPAAGAAGDGRSEDERVMAAARQVMETHREVLARLAK